MRLLLALVVFVVPSMAISATIDLANVGDVTVTDNVVRVRDIAPGAPPALADVQLLVSPRWGATTCLSRDRVAARLRRSTPHKVQLVGPDTVCISRPGHDRGNELRSAITEALSRASSDTLKIEPLLAKRPLWTPVGSLKVVIPKIERRAGRQVLRVQVRVGQSFSKEIAVTCRVSRELSVPITTRTLSLGDTVFVHDVRWERRWVERETRLARRSELRSGMRVKRSVATAQPLLASAVQTVPWVRSGDRVELLVQRAGVRVTAKARALQNGWQGSRVRVQTTSGDRYFYGKVVAKGVVLYE